MHKGEIMNNYAKGIDGLFIAHLNELNHKLNSLNKVIDELKTGRVQDEGLYRRRRDLNKQIKLLRQFLGMEINI